MAKIKFCGMTNVEDCEKAIELAADYVGFVFYKKSKRRVSPETVRLISEEIGGRIGKVGVFVEEGDDEIRAIMEFCHLDLCQVHRPSTIEKSITVFRVGERFTEAVPASGLLLFDSYSPGFGGSGRSFDFRILEGSPFLDRSFIAGGIRDDNVLEALRLKPYGVDLVSFVEQYPGKKDHRLMEAFVRTARGR